MSFRQSARAMWAAILVLAAMGTASGQVYTWYFKNMNSDPASAHGSNVLAVERVGFNDDSSWEWEDMGDMDLVMSYRSSSGAWRVIRVVKLRTPQGRFDDNEGCLYRNFGVFRWSDLPAAVGANTEFRVCVVERDGGVLPNWTGIIIAGINYLFTGALPSLSQVIRPNQDDVILDMTLSRSELMAGVTLSNNYVNALHLKTRSAIAEINPSSWPMSNTTWATPSSTPGHGGHVFIDPPETATGQSARYVLSGVRVGYGSDIIKWVRPWVRRLQSDGTLGPEALSFRHGCEGGGSVADVKVTGKIVTGVRYQMSDRVRAVQFRFDTFTGGSHPSVGTASTMSPWLGSSSPYLVYSYAPPGRPAVGLGGYSGDVVDFLRIAYATID